MEGTCELGAGGVEAAAGDEGTSVCCEGEGSEEHLGLLVERLDREYGRVWMVSP